MLIVMLLRSLDVETHQMYSATFFTFENDPFHKVQLELVCHENHRHVTIHVLKVLIKRKASNENRFLHPSPQVHYFFLLFINSTIVPSNEHLFIFLTTCLRSKILDQKIYILEVFFEYNEWQYVVQICLIFYFFFQL